MEIVLTNHPVIFAFLSSVTYFCFNANYFFRSSSEKLVCNCWFIIQKQIRVA